MLKMLVRKTIRFEPDVAKAINAYSKKTGIKIERFVNDWIKEKLQEINGGDDATISKTSKPQP
jgi:hypothetical protein